MVRSIVEKELAAADALNQHISVNEPDDFVYVLTYSEGILSLGNPTLAQTLNLKAIGRVLVVIDANCYGLYGSQLRAYFCHYGVTPYIHMVPGGEGSKNLGVALEIIDAFGEFGIMRRSQPVLCIGGGVVMDVVGFAASIYRRGIPYVRVPTTLLGIVDACVGVKTGITHGKSKNRLGTYYAPRQVLIDSTFLETLPKRELRNGVAEILKLALILDHALLGNLELYGEAAIAAKFRDFGGSLLIREAIRLMLGQLSGNMREHNLSRLVDFGHSFSPHMEMCRGNELLHGEAVALDMAVCLAVSLHRGLVDEAFAQRVLRVYQRLGLSILDDSFSGAELHKALDDIVLHRDGRQRVPLPRGTEPGVFADDLTSSDLTMALDYLRLFSA
jgi:3-dehydroquinate synthetase